jgi:hypothetical protein
MPLPLAPFFVASQLLVTVADKVPVLDARPSCSVARRSADEAKDRDNCLEEEQNARTQLIKDWGQYAASDRSDCVELATTGGTSSYIELLTCLEMAKAVKESRAADRGSRQTTGRGQASEP